MSILINGNSKVIVLGITGKQGRKVAREMMDYGTNIVAGVTPGKAGERIDGVPVYNTIMEASDEHPDADICFMSVPRDAARDAAVAVISSKRFSLLNILTEGIANRDAAVIVQCAEDHDVRVVGPASIGIIVPSEKIKVGPIGGNDPGVFYPGRIALFSKSGGMCLSIAMDVFNQLGYGIRMVVGIGGDRIAGTTFEDLLRVVRDDPETRLVILNGEVGGTYEEDAARYIKETGYPKRVVARLTGVGAEAMFPAGARLGHAGAIIGSGGEGTYDSKVHAFEAAGVPVAKTANELIMLVDREMPHREEDMETSDSATLELVSVAKTKLDNLKTQARAVQTKTSLTRIHSGTPYFRGYALPELMRKAGVMEMRYMAITREDPQPDDLVAFKKIYHHFQACVPADAALKAAKVSFEQGNPLNAACAAGLLALPGDGTRNDVPHSDRLGAAELEAVFLIAQTSHIVAHILGDEQYTGDDKAPEEVFFRAMTNRVPTEGEAALVRAIYVACVDHTPATPSSLAGLVSYSGGNSLKTALAAAITAMGDVHAGAGEGAAKVMQDTVCAFNKSFKAKGQYEVDGQSIASISDLARYLVGKFTGKFGGPKRKIPGYGHRYYGFYGKDPRAATVFEIAKEQGVAGQYIELAATMEQILCDEKSPMLCMNVDGAIGAIISEMGIDWHAGKATFIIPRTVGILGELLEQQAGSFFRLANESTVYKGPPVGREFHPCGR